MRKVFCFLVLVLGTSLSGRGQVYFPFKEGESQSSVLAYWYNCKPGIAVEAAVKDTTFLHSSLQVYGPAISDSFYVKVEVFLPDSNLVYVNNYLLNGREENKDYKVDIVNDYFRLTSSVDQLSDNPDRIKVTIYSSETRLEKWIACKYHRIFGHTSDFRGNALKAFILIKPDDFSEVSGVWSDAKGYYEIDLPERTYNTFYVNDGNYKSTTLEAWAWHMIVDDDQELDFRIGTGEVYNLNVWSNNGGFGTFLLSFRPMVLIKTNRETSGKQTIDGKEFTLIDIAPELDIKDLNIKINGERTEIYSLQKYFETGANRALPAYLVQVRRLGSTFGKQTICVEYDKTIELDGTVQYQNSMGYFQFYTNFTGLSAFD